MSVVGPAYDLVTVMSKLLHLGMPMDDIIRAVTSTAASALGPCAAVPVGETPEAWHPWATSLSAKRANLLLLLTHTLPHLTTCY